MNKLNTTLLELLNMLKIAESYFKSEKAPLLLVDKKKIKVEKKGSKRKQNPKSNIQKRKKVKKDFTNGAYYHYGKQGH